MSIVQKLVTEDSFVNGVFVPAGQIASYNEADLSGKEAHIHDPSGLPPAVIEMAPIGPTGPNPTAPQQISHDTVQGPGGAYLRPGGVVVAQTTLPQELRLAGRSEEGDSAEGDNLEALRKANEETARLRAELAAAQTGRAAPSTDENDDDDLVAGTVADITATLGEKSDEELEAIRAAEVDREKPRAGVLNAIKAELANRG